jgi:uncharacterized FlaG/YvyC family protein
MTPTKKKQVMRKFTTEVVLQMLVKDNPISTQQGIRDHRTKLSIIATQPDKDKMPSRNDDFLSAIEDFEKTSEYLNERYFNFNTLKSYFSLIVSVADKYTKNLEWKIPEETIAFYLAKMNENIDNAVKVSDHNKPKDSISNILWKDVVDARNRWIKDVFNKRILSKQTKENLQIWIITGLYTLHPPRRLDWGSLKVFYNKDPHPWQTDWKPVDNVKDSDRTPMDTRDNYVVIITTNKKAKKNRTVQLVIHNFKNCKKMGTYRAYLHNEFKELAEVINRYVATTKMKNGDNFFKQQNFSPAVKSAFTKIMPDGDFSFSDNENPSSNDLRHLYIEQFNKINPTLEARKKLATQMG